MVTMRPYPLLALLLLGACASTSETYPGRTATEQLLVARAADSAVEGLTLPVDKTARVYVDDAFFRAESAPYAVSAIRSALSASGHALASTREQADVVFEIRSGALSLEQMRRGFGVPEMRLPINDPFHVVPLPEPAVHTRRDRVDGAR